MTDMKTCPICGISPNSDSEYGALIAEDDYTQIWARAYPGGGFTLCASGESEIELPLNFCPVCGRDLRRADEKRGTWIDTGDGYSHCSECGYGHPDYYCYLPPFCPKCGARMERET